MTKIDLVISKRNLIISLPSYIYFKKYAFISTTFTHGVNFSTAEKKISRCFVDVDC